MRQTVIHPIQPYYKQPPPPPQPHQRSTPEGALPWPMSAMAPARRTRTFLGGSLGGGSRSDERLADVRARPDGSPALAPADDPAEVVAAAGDSGGGLLWPAALADLVPPSRAGSIRNVSPWQAANSSWEADLAATWMLRKLQRDTGASIRDTGASPRDTVWPPEHAPSASTFTFAGGAGREPGGAPNERGVAAHLTRSSSSLHTVTGTRGHVVPDYGSLQADVDGVVQAAKRPEEMCAMGPMAPLVPQHSSRRILRQVERLEHGKAEAGKLAPLDQRLRAVKRIQSSSAILMPASVRKEHQGYFDLASAVAQSRPARHADRPPQCPVDWSSSYRERLRTPQRMPGPSPEISAILASARRAAEPSPTALKPPSSHAITQEPGRHPAAPSAQTAEALRAPQKARSPFDGSALRSGARKRLLYGPPI